MLAVLGVDAPGPGIRSLRSARPRLLFGAWNRVTNTLSGFKPGNGTGGNSGSALPELSCRISRAVCWVM